MLNILGIQTWLAGNALKFGGLVAMCAVIWLHGCNYGGDRQQAKTDKLRVEFNTFVAKTKEEGDAAAARAKAIDAANQMKKEKADAENTRTIAELRDSIGRMRLARARGSYLPSAPADSPNPESITFDRAELERAIRQLDERVQDLIGEGDEKRIHLDTAIRWGAQWAAGEKDAGGGLKPPK